jgi:hypothetical protein
MPYYPPPSSGGSFLPLAGGTMTGTITSTIGTVTSDTPVLSATQTWNSAGVTFNGILLNITNTASAAASKFADFQVAGTSKASIGKAGTFRASDGTAADPSFGWPSVGNGMGFYSRTAYAIGVSIDGVQMWEFDATGTRTLRQTSSNTIGWTPNSNSQGAIDTAVSRNAAGVAEITNGSTGTFRDLKLRDLTASGQVTIGGTSASSSAGQVSIGGVTRTTIGANGAASALTALPLGYIDAYVGSTPVSIPYYNRGA